MMHLERLVLGDFQANCYLVWGDGSASCAVIDPGQKPEKVLEKAQSLNLTVEAILLTHGHFDHVGGVQKIAEETGCPVYMHAADYHMKRNLMRTYLYPLAGRDLKGLRFFEEGDEIAAGGLSFQVLETPGHTEGSVCLRCEDVLFTGDTLFAGSQGRTDLAGGDAEKMAASMAKLRELPFAGRIFPGHGSDSTMALERGSNPFLRGNS